VLTDLTVTLQEVITLPNGNKEILQNINVIPSITQIKRGIDTISIDANGSGVEIMRFVDSESEKTAGSFVKSKVKYIRITNLDSTNYTQIYLLDKDSGYEGESTLLKITPRGSLMFTSADFNSSQVSDYVVENVWDQDYYSDYTTFNLIKAKANTASTQLEYFVATT